MFANVGSEQPKARFCRAKDVGNLPARCYEFAHLSGDGLVASGIVR